MHTIRTQMFFDYLLLEVTIMKKKHVNFFLYYNPFLDLFYLLSANFYAATLIIFPYIY